MNKDSTARCEVGNGGQKNVARPTPPRNVEDISGEIAALDQALKALEMGLVL